MFCDKEEGLTIKPGSIQQILVIMNYVRPGRDISFTRLSDDFDDGEKIYNSLY